jgi:Mg-chelatase subunit ChlD
MDVAPLPGGDFLVAEYGNRRLQRLDPVGNPVARWPVAGRPRALAVTPQGRVLVLLDDETVRVLDDSGAEVGRFGGFGRAPGQLQLAWDLAALPDGRVLVADRGNARVQVFRPLVSGETPPAEPTAGATSPPPTPIVQRLSACPERPAQLDLAVTVPSAPPRADVLIVVDTTGSMESLLSTIRQRVADIRAALSGASGDVAVGLMDVRDFPYGGAGLGTDWPWLLRAPVSTDPALLEAAAADLWSGGGGDAPEAYAGALVAALDDPRVGWRPGARRFIVLLGDAVPRDVDLNEGVSNPDLPGVWTPGQPGTWRDSGPDWAPGTTDDVRWLATLDRLKGAEVTLLVGVTGVAPLELAGNPGALVRYWQQWAARSGPGGAAVLASDLTRLTDRLATLVGDAGRHITRLAGVAGPGDYRRWVTFEPPAYLDLDVPPAGLSRSFAARIAPPPDTPDGTYNLVLDVVGDGARYAAVEVTLAWQAVCEATPTVGPASATPRPATTVAPSVTPTATRSVAATPTATGTATASPRPRGPILLPITMKGNCLGLSRVVSDIVLVLDTSSSMRAEGKLDAALGAAGGFIDLVDLRRDHVALVAFDSHARLAVGLTGERARLASGLAGLVTGEGTRLDRGLDAAVTELTGPRARPAVRRVVILLTDGLPDTGTEAQLDAVLRRAQSVGSLVFTVGLGSDVDAVLLRRLAGDASRYYPAPAKGDLERIYRRIAEVLPCG